MSGRKATEVSALLGKAKKAREAGESRYRNCLNNASEEIQENQKQINQYFAKIQKSVCRISKDCTREFPKESKKLSEQFSEVKQKNHTDYLEELSELQKRDKKIQNDLSGADRESQNIKDRIRNKSHYCDVEYRDADQLVSRYKNIANERDRLCSSFNTMVSGSSQESIVLQSAVQRLAELEKERKALEEKTKQILQLREKAGEAKAFLKKLMEKIDSDIAEKFMKRQYKQIKKRVQECEQMSDQQIVENVSTISEEIGIFKTELDSRYAAFLEEKQKAEDALSKCRDLLSDNFYYAPVDYIKNKEQAQKMGLLSYLEEYGSKQDMIHEIEDGIAQAEDALQNEQFEQAEDFVKKTRERIEKAASYANILQENMLKNAYTTMDIRNVMRKFGYETGAFIIDKNPKNGWKIEAMQGGEVIHFDKIYVDEAGKVDIQIDHKLDAGGSCHARWEEITKALDEEGIFVKNIKMENGSTVIDKINGIVTETRSDGGLAKQPGM